MKKKAKVDWDKVWKRFNKITDGGGKTEYWAWSAQKEIIERLVERQLSHKPKKVKGRK